MPVSFLIDAFETYVIICQVVSGSFAFFRDREQSTHHTLIRQIYIPVQFENSLGKLQFASVTAPRKVIDMDVVPNSDPQSATQIQQKDMRRTRQLLLEIERVLIFCFLFVHIHRRVAMISVKGCPQLYRRYYFQLYVIQLNLEDLHNPLALLNEQQTQERETDASTVEKARPELINMMLLSLLQLIQNDKLTSMLSIRKGKVCNPKVFANS